MEYLCFKKALPSVHLSQLLEDASPLEEENPRRKKTRDPSIRGLDTEDEERESLGCWSRKRYQDVPL